MRAADALAKEPLPARRVNFIHALNEKEKQVSARTIVSNVERAS
jgi:hypothetical protein